MPIFKWSGKRVGRSERRDFSDFARPPDVSFGPASGVSDTRPRPVPTGVGLRSGSRYIRHAPRFRVPPSLTRKNHGKTTVKPTPKSLVSRLSFRSLGTDHCEEKLYALSGRTKCAVVCVSSAWDGFDMLVYGADMCIDTCVAGKRQAEDTRAFAKSTGEDLNSSTNLTLFYFI